MIATGVVLVEKMEEEKKNDQLTPEEREKKKLEKKAAKEAKKLEKELKKKQRQEAEAAKKLKAAESDVSKGFYGKLPLIQSKTREGKLFSKVSELTDDDVNKTVVLRARLHTVREMSSAVFMKLRQRTHSIQAVLILGDKVSKLMHKYVAKLNPESIVDVEGVVAKPENPVESCSVQNFELVVSKCFVVSEAVPRLPLQLDDASREENDPMLPNQNTCLNNRILDLRAEPNQAIFKIQAGVCTLFRETLNGRGFTEIHSPKMISAASESGSSVFELTYFKSKAYLAQSPQLYKQMAIASDFERVYEVGPVFRAENSFTHRHLTEFTGLDLEMAFNEHYHEVLEVIGDTFVQIFRGLNERFSHEIEVVRKQYNREPFTWLEPTLRIEWPEGIQMLRDAGEEIGDFDDIGTPQEKLLGRLVKEKYNTDFYILDKFPLCIRPFYTMPSPEDERYSNSYDIMMRGEEIMSGAQRIHDPVLLEERAKEHGIDFSEMHDYLECFKFGCPPHGGGGVGMERVVMLFLGLPNIRKTSLFPRDPTRLTP
eukprot:m.7147 g.7147  ORF g.7147 m.7147 type:complete len:540 (+) comp2717_c0_seq1:1-1620(+)